jgi:hypothetical protein
MLASRSGTRPAAPRSRTRSGPGHPGPGAFRLERDLNSRVRAGSARRHHRQRWTRRRGRSISANGFVSRAGWRPGGPNAIVQRPPTRSCIRPRPTNLAPPRAGCAARLGQRMRRRQLWRSVVSSRAPLRTRTCSRTPESERLYGPRDAEVAGTRKEQPRFSFAARGTAVGVPRKAADHRMKPALEFEVPGPLAEASRQCAGAGKALIW